MQIAKVLASVLIVGCCPTSKPVMSAGGANERQRCEAMHWVDLDRTDAIRVLNINVRSPTERSGLEEIVDRLRKAREEMLSAPPQHADPLDERTAQAEDKIVVAARRIAREIEPAPKLIVLPLVSRSGIVIDRGQGPGALDAAIVSGLQRLRNRGETTDVIETPYGLHVLVLLETVPGHTASDAERRKQCP